MRKSGWDSKLQSNCQLKFLAPISGSVLLGSFTVSLSKLNLGSFRYPINLNFLEMMNFSTPLNYKEEVFDKNYCPLFEKIIP
jgi:hypothetical protein